MCKGVNVDKAGGATDFKLNTVQGSNLCMWKSFAMASSIGDVCEAARAGLGNLLFFPRWYMMIPKTEIRKRKREAIQGKDSRITFQHALWLSWKQIRIKTFGNFQGEYMVTGCFLGRLSLKWTRKSSQDMVAHNAVASACAKAQQWLEACAESAVFQCSYVFVSFEFFLDDAFSDIYF